MLASCNQDGTVKLWDGRSATCLETLRVQRPYEKADITGATGLTAAQKETLKLLGAIDHAAEPVPLGVNALNPLHAPGIADSTTDSMTVYNERQ